MQLAVSSSVSSADCFEAHVGILSRTACLWVQQALVSITFLFLESRVLWQHCNTQFSKLLKSLTYHDYDTDVKNLSRLQKLYYGNYNNTSQTLGETSCKDEDPSTGDEESWKEQAFFLRWDHNSYGISVLNKEIISSLDEAVPNHDSDLHRVASLSLHDVPDPLKQTDSQRLVQIPPLLEIHKALAAFSPSKKEHFLSVLQCVQATSYSISKHMDNTAFAPGRTSNWCAEVCY